ncbi:MAG TPA: hypothetical protein PK322_01175 [Opitutaceae bacterium]|nr:hypothetical protein [Opitutaceae bacterium]
MNPRRLFLAFASVPTVSRSAPTGTTSPTASTKPAANHTRGPRVELG